MPYDLIIFDYDGVVADSEVLNSTVMAEQLTAIGLPTSLDQVLATYTGRRWRDNRPVVEAALGRPCPEDFHTNWFAACRARAPLHLKPVPGLIDFVIPASQAFGTGQHKTTAGCLEMLGHMKASGMAVRNVADIGTGTGLLGFAALALWPRALCTLTDIDPVCVPVVEENAATNGIPMGPRAGEAVMIVADGMEDPLLQVRGPYDLLIANILAGPLVSLAPDFGKAVPPGGSLLLAGLLAGEQEAAVKRAMHLAGFRMAARLQRGDWAILWLRRRSNWGRRPRR